MKRLITSTVLMMIAFTATAETLTGRVVGITDGDTIKLLTDSNVLHKIRLSGIDAPEKNQAFGTRSKQALSDCAYDKVASVESYKKDRYGRVVGKVMVNSADCNLRQIELGMAWHYKKYEGEQELEDRSRYAQAEYQAQKSRRGLWMESNPVAPWDFRQSKRKGLR